LASFYFNPENVPAVGVSGAIFGLFAAMLVTGKRMGVDYRSVGGIIVVNLIITFVVPQIDWHAHVGGLVGGAAATYIIKALR
jgi:rhomboid protease GluP